MLMTDIVMLKLSYPLSSSFLDTSGSYIFFAPHTHYV